MISDRYLVTGMHGSEKCYFGFVGGEAVFSNDKRHAWKTDSAAAANETLRLCRKAYPGIEWRIERIGL